MDGLRVNIRMAATIENKSISIVIATYNGGKYISEQLDSILKNDEFYSLVKEIIITDDGSTDDTLNIVCKYVNNYKFISLKKTNNNAGVISNFMHGLSYATGDYIMFCDQDDFWLPNKIKMMHKKISDMEAEVGENIPLLAFSDLKIVDEKLNETHPSFLEFNRVVLPKSTKLEHLFLNNIAPGCVCIFNKELVTSIDIKNTKGWLMHDWWFLLTAASLGKIGFVNEALMLYRQHGNNVVGASRKSTFKKIIMLTDTIKDYNNSLKKRLNQKKEFLNFIKNSNSKHYEDSFFSKKNGFVNFISWGVKSETTSKRKVLFLIYSIPCYFKEYL